MINPLTRRRRRRAEDEARWWREWHAWMGGMVSDVRELVTVAQAAELTGRARSTVHGWIASRKVHRVDGGGQGVLAQLPLMEVLRAEHGVRGKGRKPRSVG